MFGGRRRRRDLVPPVRHFAQTMLPRRVPVAEQRSWVSTGTGLKGPDVMGGFANAMWLRLRCDLTTSRSAKQCLSFQASISPHRRFIAPIARRMMAGVQQAAPVTITTRVDATSLVALRAQIQGTGKSVIVPSFTDILIKLVAVALADCPRLNACWDNDVVLTYDQINVGFAVDTERGLVAPVIRDVAALSLIEIAKRSSRLADQARAGTLSHDQLQGGTFTVTNLGMFDIDFFTPILNLPQAAILGIGRIVREPIVRAENVAIGEVLSLSLTFDHRVIDGGPAARWLQRLTELIKRTADVLSGSSGSDRGEPTSVDPETP